MTSNKLFKEVANSKDVYRIITYRGEFVEQLNGEDAINEYGNSYCTGWYTTGFTADGGRTADVWIAPNIKEFEKGSELSKLFDEPVYALSNGARITVFTDCEEMDELISKGYFVDAIFENGRRVDF